MKLSPTVANLTKNSKSATLKAVFYIIAAAILYALAILFGASASRNINTNFAAGFSNLFGAVIPLIVAIPFITRSNLSSHKFGVVMTVASGICLALFVMALTKSYSLNKVGIVAPIVFGGAIVLSTLLSTLVFKEKISLIEGMGLAILTLGFGIIIYARVAAK